jgi:hypothetical protein
VDWRANSISQVFMIGVDNNRRNISSFALFTLSGYIPQHIPHHYSISSFWKLIISIPNLIYICFKNASISNSLFTSSNQTVK